MSPIQQSFNDRDSAGGALDGANKDQQSAGEQALKIRDETNKEQLGGFAKDFMPHPSMSSDQAGVQQGVANTYQQGQANAVHDSKVPTPNKCLRAQAGAGRKSIFRRKSLSKKKRTKKTTKKRRKREEKAKEKAKEEKKISKKRGGKRRRSMKPRYRFSQRAPLKV